MNEFATILSYAAPVALAAIGETVVERSGVIHIGIEGGMLAGAFFAMLTTYATGSPWLGIGVGVVVGVLLALLSAVFCVTLLADQVVIGTAVNLLAIGLTRTLFALRFGASGQLLSVEKIPSMNGLDAVTIGTVILAVLVHLALTRTGWGLATRSAGEFPEATEAAGYSVAKLRYGALAFGGALAGLGGAYLSLGIAGSFADNMTAGRGFVAIAMVTFGRWKPVWALLASLLIGWVDSLQFTFQTKGWDAPFQLFVALPYLVALLVLAGVGRGANAPAALATPFRRSR
ncbi:MAG: ABC transporter permease [Fimbriimonadaceae bacterium]|nr:ABC transporter permease [Fimbriimonadaceae bacterium]